METATHTTDLLTEALAPTSAQLPIPPEPPKKTKHAVPKVTFADITSALFSGCKIRRGAWRGEKWVVRMGGMHLAAYNNQDEAKRVNDRTASFVGHDCPLLVLPYYAVFYGKVNGKGKDKWQVGWVPDAKDLEATDWMVKE